MFSILQQLHELDSIYHTTPLATYEAALQTAVMQIQRAFPGFTIAYAEIYTAGSEREAHGGMRHVLLPQQGESDLPGPDTYSLPNNHTRTIFLLPDP